MSDSLKQTLLGAFRVLLGPLVRILLRHGISYAEFAEAVDPLACGLLARLERDPQQALKYVNQGRDAAEDIHASLMGG